MKKIFQQIKQFIISLFMKTIKQDLGKVSITCNGEYDSSKEYDRLCIVNNGGITYISKIKVPKNISINDETYWQPITVNNNETNISNNYITNNPDEEDLTEINNVIKFKNRDSGDNKLGYYIIRQNIVNEENILTSLPYENTIYEIRYDFKLSTGSLQIPDGSILYFNGGSLRDGDISGNNITFIGKVSLINITISGTLYNDTVYVDWFNFKKASSLTDGTNSISAEIFKNLIYIQNIKNIIFGNGIYLFDDNIVINKNISDKVFKGAGYNKTMLYFPDSSAFFITKCTFLNILFEDLYFNSAEDTFNFGNNEIDKTYGVNNLQFKNIAVNTQKSFINIYDLDDASSNFYFKNIYLNIGKNFVNNLFLQNSFFENIYTKIIPFNNNDIEERKLKILFNNCIYANIKNSSITCEKFYYNSFFNLTNINIIKITDCEINYENLIYANGLWTKVMCNNITLNNISPTNTFDVSINKCFGCIGLPTYVYNNKSSKYKNIYIEFSEYKELTKETYEIPNIDFYNDGLYKTPNPKNYKENYIVNPSTGELEYKIIKTAEYNNADINVLNSVLYNYKDITIPNTGSSYFIDLITPQYLAYNLIVNENSVKSLELKTYSNNIKSNIKPFILLPITVKNSSYFVLKVKLKDKYYNILPYETFMFDPINNNIIKTSKVYFYSTSGYIIKNVNENQFIRDMRGRFNYVLAKSNCNVACNNPQPTSNKEVTAYDGVELNINNCYTYDGKVYICIESGTVDKANTNKANNINEIIINGTAKYICIGESDIFASTSGETIFRPTNVYSGFQYYDTTLNKLILWIGNKWVDVNGTTV